MAKLPRLKVGDLVKKHHPYDGSHMGGYPVGTSLKVVEICDYRPINGICEEKVVAILSDGSRAFIWNLSKVGV